MQFYNPSGFSWMILVPIFLLLFWAREWRKARVLSRFADREMIPKISPHLGRERFFWKAAFFLAAIFFIVLALARPQWGEEKRQVQRKGADLVFLLDTSLSMLAQDIKPNRFDRAKIEIRNFVKKLKGDRIALVAFAGAGFLQAPLTIDYGAFLLFLDAVKVGYIPDPGSSLEEAIRTALAAFPKSDKKYRVMILFTDGEETTSQSEMVIKRARELGVRIYAVGLGTHEGAPIPLKDERGAVSGFKKDRLGKTVISKLDDNLLEKMAQETGGLYFPSTPGEKELELIYTHIEGLGKRIFKAREVVEKEERFQFFLSLALIFLILEMLVGERKRALHEV